MRRLLIALLVVAFLILLSIRQPSTHESVEIRTKCPQCLGGGRIQCPNCRGFGSVESETRIPCAHCNGTGVIQKKLSTSSAPCPFCGAVGSTPGHSRENCTACGGYGITVCPKCGGACFVTTTVEKESRPSPAWWEPLERGWSSLRKQFVSADE